MKKTLSIGNLTDEIISDDGQNLAINFTNEASEDLFITDLVQKNHFKKIFYISHNSKKLRQKISILESLTFQNSSDFEITSLPNVARWGRDKYIQLNNTLYQRMRCLFHLSNSNRTQIVFSGLESLLHPTISIHDIEKDTLSLKKGLSLNPDSLTEKLLELGYKHSERVHEIGYFTSRGSIFDIFCPVYDVPLRIDLFEDKVQSMRFYDPGTQKSSRHIEEASLTPVTEFQRLYSKDQTVIQKTYDFLLHSDFDSTEVDSINRSFNEGRSFPGIESFLPVVHPVENILQGLQDSRCLFIFEKGLDFHFGEHQNRLDHYKRLHDSDISDGKLSFDPHKTFLAELNTHKHPRVFVNDPFCNPDNTIQLDDTTLYGETTEQGGWFNHICQSHKTTKYLLLSPTDEGIKRIENIFQNRDIPTERHPWFETSMLYGNFPDGKVHMAMGNLDGYHFLKGLGFCVMGESALFGKSSSFLKRRRKNSKAKNFISSFSALEIQDLVIHSLYGLGRYAGLKKLKLTGVESDFLQIEYAGNDKIYIPVDRLNLLQKYASGSDKPFAKLDKLGSEQWNKRKSKVKKEVKELAEKLLKIQAKRASSRPNIYQEKSEDYFRFESLFPYSETEDQLLAIDAIQNDLSSGKMMDRLICGDVGFGKTEVAMRACFRAVKNLTQVIVLCPTTVLCFQHFRTFASRMQPFGIRVRQVNRFVPKKTILETLDEFSKGHVDILIGTHRALSKDVTPSKLGMIVVDEEQRFGVTHKEKLKEMRANADMLTLTATPIPRTLHMAMAGLKDISILATPPKDRLPIKTYVSSYDESLIKEAIEFEVSRSGQVFFLHNKVADISQVAGSLQSLLPNISVRFAHGQMTEKQLESVIVDFMDQKFSVLVCTTIIESGIDMPNVNTIIVNNAEKLGLAQMYQIKGRVGRSERQSYAYLITKDRKHLSEVAIKRLNTIVANQHLGAGFQIASQDLEIRGSGSLLGDKQSGQMKDIGVEMYSRLLEEAIQELKGEEPENKELDPEIKLPIAVSIPENFIHLESERIALYRRYFSIENYLELEKINEDLIDRYGILPPAISRLNQLAKIKFLLKILSGKTITWSEKAGATIQFDGVSETIIDRMIQAVHKHPNIYQLSPDYRLFVKNQAKYNNGHSGQMDLMNDIIKAIEPFAIGS